MIVNNGALSSRYLRTDFLSRDGYEFVISSDHWRLSKDVAFYPSDIDELIGSELSVSFRQVLAVYAETCSANYAKNLFTWLKPYLEFCVGFEPFSSDSLISYRASLGKNDWMLSSIRVFMRTWTALGYPGVPPQALSMIEKWKIKGNEKGYAVQSMCPESGPLTDIEMDGIVSSVIEGFAEGRIKLRDTCYAMILSLTGRRPIQITALKIKDLIKPGQKYYVNFPRAKQRHADWRSSFSKFEIVEDLWVLLQSQAEAVRLAFEDAYGKALERDLILELPLFPALGNYDPKGSLKDQLDGDFLHARSQEVAEVMRSVKEIIGVVSERTGAVTHLNAYRFRYTLGTNLAREGKGEYVIAEALDHSDLQNAGVYVKNIPDIVERIDKAVALQLAPLAQAFQGVLVVNESKARRGDDRSSRICSAGGNVGTCGSYGFCGALAPIACYTCSHFQPWLDGPHEFVLEELIAERDGVLASTGDLKIASVNDRLILAVSDVVTRCNAMKGDSADE